jgi:hypothetical protein
LYWIILSAEDRHNAWYNLATLYAAKNDFAGTEWSLRESIAWSPEWFKPHWMLARTLALAGRADEARLEASIAVDLNNGRNPEVAASLGSK